MPSFDIVSEVSPHELSNAIDQTTREISTRFDFKGSSAAIEMNASQDLWIYGDNDFQLEQIRDIFLSKAVKRQLEPGSFDFQDIQSNHANVKRQIVVKQGISTEFGKKIVKLVKELKLKVQASIQQDQVRITGKKRDDLQETMAALKQAGLEQPLQYQNFRD